MAHRLYYRDDRNNGFCRACYLIAVANDISAGERAYTVMHTDHTFGIVGNEGEAMLYAVETGLATIS